MATLKYTNFPKKTILKWNKELVELHKRVLITYLSSRGLSYRNRCKFFLLYDRYIDESNIKEYFYIPTQILVQGLVLDKINSMTTYIYPKSKNNGKKKRTSNSHR